MLKSKIHFTGLYARGAIACLLTLTLLLTACGGATVTPVSNSSSTPTVVRPANSTLAATRAANVAAPTIRATVSPTAATLVGTTTPKLKAEAGDTVVNLTWLPISDVQGFFVYRDGNPIALNSSPTIGSAYQDSGLTNNRSYSYTIAVLDAAGQPELKSNVVQVTPKSKQGQ